MKKGMTVNKLAEILKNEFANSPINKKPCNCRNKLPADGWSVCGKAGITRAIIKAGLRYNQYWSGSAPTPSTQAPSEIVQRAYEIAYK